MRVLGTGILRFQLLKTEYDIEFFVIARNKKLICRNLAVSNCGY
jgi:hypothetical protein